MGTITMANSAAAALLSLQMMDTKSRGRGLKRRGFLADEDQARARLSNPPAAATKVEEKLCHCDVLPEDVLAQCLSHLDSFQDMASVSRACKRWREGIQQSLACQTKLSFAGWRPDDGAISRLVKGAGSLKELNISNGRWGCRITDVGLIQVSIAKCCPNLASISLWGVTAITDEGVVQLVRRAASLEHFNVGGTFITDVSVLALASHCKLLKSINLWCCRHVTETGLLAVVKGCQKLESINVWGMSISPSCRRRLKLLNPKLHLKPAAANHSS
ncbi:F-box protein At5g67140 isoform X2 [Physcomitrium patens]|uniref:F-box domain-containing protein n=2 Tax=Physcomitrium patens TaxID=3218 RepID=A0A2K1KBV6_PHYPA|nr:F-box protein At5g67140-like [Physcomitrium patens]XP_024379850.1 F-box protein At5g67140-like [Physcomitrium patens]XP_024379852.1 F-box protein At5g67140-like [Physcomitrium patens]XP_024379853.1 F-box protein At5g67140-like [Physcomitrium patens]XP_024379854.1 F-box protein At5g67140-like [Physcomitrium patens]XP_024379855.1 F-box protein At5g67140-like [Physcomitrium patens]PNR51253.1 hypothetical protein PHYPA_010439 [Physcomitrium patens]|eukprot:XP_024379849.1 F-box protein At5g67140-like [Physcomitrella patens]